MREFDLKFLKKIKIWYKKNDNLMLCGRGADSVKFESSNAPNVFNTTVIIELFIPRGGRNIYGLLGVDYVSGLSDCVDVTVSHGDIAQPKLLDNSLAGRLDKVQIVLPDVLRASIFEQIQVMSDSHVLNLKGNLNFCYGAFSEISSSESMFRLLTNLVVKLLHISECDVSPDLLNKFLDE